jgi:regulator of protease activity HflC (stomatin/prohibitin superfamily)
MKKILFMICVICSLSACGVEQVDTGNRGVKTVWGEVKGESLPEGLYFYNPFSTSIHEINCKTVKNIYNFETYTKDVQQAKIDVSINYSVDSTKAHLLFKEVGTYYSNQVIEPKVIQAVKDIIGKWEADNLIANREKATSEILNILKETLTVNYINVENVVLENIEYTPEFERAIEEKQIATQDAIKAKNKTKQVEEEANQKVLAAKAEAESMRIRSQALSQNQNLVSYEAVQKWDGKLPVNIYGSAPIPFINSVK